MQISIKHGYVFLSMPKCASTSIEHEISKYSDASLVGHPAIKHISARKYKKHIEPLFLNKIKRNKLELVCLIREPVDWLHSWYRYRARKELLNPRHPNHKNYTGHITFSEFAEFCMSDKKPPFAKAGTQSYFLEDGEGNCLVDKVYPLELMAELENYLRKKTGEDVRIPKLNVSPRKEKLIDDKTHQRLLLHLEKDYYYYRRSFEDRA